MLIQAVLLALVSAPSIHASTQDKRPFLWYVDLPAKGEYSAAMPVYEVSGDGRVRASDVTSKWEGAQIAWDSHSQRLVAYGKATMTYAVPLAAGSGVISSDLNEGMISPDGRELAYIVCERAKFLKVPGGLKDWALEILNRDTGRARQVAELADLKRASKEEPLGGVTSLRWSPDGRRMAVCVTGERRMGMYGDLLPDLAYDVDVRSRVVRYLGFGFQAIWVDNDRLAISSDRNTDPAAVASAPRTSIERSKPYTFPNTTTRIIDVRTGRTLAQRIRMTVEAVSADRHTLFGLVNGSHIHGVDLQEFDFQLRPTKFRAIHVRDTLAFDPPNYTYGVAAR